MGELPTTLTKVEAETISRGIEDAKSPEDVIAARELVQEHLAGIAAATIASETDVEVTPRDGEAFSIPLIGADEMDRLTKPDPEAVKDAMATNSATWHNEHMQ